MVTANIHIQEMSGYVPPYSFAASKFILGKLKRLYLFAYPNRQRKWS